MSISDLTKFLAFFLLSLYGPTSSSAETLQSNSAFECSIEQSFGSEPGAETIWFRLITKVSSLERSQGNRVEKFHYTYEAFGTELVEKQFIEVGIYGRLAPLERSFGFALKSLEFSDHDHDYSRFSLDEIEAEGFESKGSFRIPRVISDRGFLAIYRCNFSNIQGRS